MKRYASLLAVVVLAAFLFGCSSSSSDDNDKSAQAERAEQKEAQKEKVERERAEEKLVPICPQVAILRDVDTVFDYGAEKPSLDQLVSGARMESVTGDCSYKKDGIDIKFELSLVGAKGPRLGGLRTSFPYFVAVLDPQQNILNKDRMTANFHFSTDEKTASISEALHVFIPLPIAKKRLGPDYQVLMGFQLTEQQFKDRMQAVSDAQQ